MNIKIIVVIISEILFEKLRKSLYLNYNEDAL